MTPDPIPDAPHLDPTVKKYLAIPELATGYDETFAHMPLFRYDVAFIRRYVKPDMTVLDLGCGTARVAIDLAQHGCRVTGVDLSPHMIAVAREKVAATALPIEIIHGDMMDPALTGDRRFDAALCMFSTLGMVFPSSERRRFCAQVRGRMAPGGVFILHVHNTRFVEAALGERIRRKLNEAISGYEEGDRVIKRYRGLVDLRLHAFTMNELHDLLTDTGYRVLRLEPLNIERDGPYAGIDPSREANGFLVAATPA